MESNHDYFKISKMIVLGLVMFILGFLSSCQFVYELKKEERKILMKGGCIEFRTNPDGLGATLMCKENK